MSITILSPPRSVSSIPSLVSSSSSTIPHHGLFSVARSFNSSTASHPFRSQPSTSPPSLTPTRAHPFCPQLRRSAHRPTHASNQTNALLTRFPHILPKSIAPSFLVISLGLLLGYSYYPSSGSKTSGSLTVDRYFPFRITKSSSIDPDTILFELDVPLPSDPSHLNHPHHPFYIQSVYLKHPALHIERPYTPLSPIPPSTPSIQHHPTDPQLPSRHPPLELLIKRYPQGELSTHAHDLKTPGNQLELRGPVPTWRHPNDQIDDIVFIAAGTGITPALQLLRRIFKPSLHPTTLNRLPNFQLIYLSRSLRSAYGLGEIQEHITHHPTRVSLKLVIDQRLDEDPSTIHVDKVGRLDLSDLQQWISMSPKPGENQDSRRIIIVCGPDSLICAVAGCKGREYGSQGEIGGMLKTLGYSSHQVVKL